MATSCQSARLTANGTTTDDSRRGLGVGVLGPRPSDNIRLPRMLEANFGRKTSVVTLKLTSELNQSLTLEGNQSSWQCWKLTSKANVQGNIGIKKTNKHEYWRHHWLEAKVKVNV